MDGYTDALVLKATELWWPSLADVSRHPLRPERSFFAAVTNTAVPFPSTTTSTSLLDNSNTSAEGVSSVGLSRLGCSVFATATIQYSQPDTTTDKEVAAKMCVLVWSPFTSAELILPVVYCPPDLTSALQDNEEEDKKIELMEFALSGRIRIVPADVASYCERHTPVRSSDAQNIDSDEALRDLLFARYSATMQSCIATFLRSADCEGGYCGILIDGAEDSGKAEFVRHVQQKMPACFDVVSNNVNNASGQQGQSSRTRYVVESRRINLAHVMSLDEREAIETVAIVLQPPLTHSSQQQQHRTTSNSDETSKVVQSECVMLRPLVFVTVEHVDLLWSEPLAQAPLIAQCVAHELCTRLDQLINNKSGAVFCMCSVAESGVGEAMPLLRRLAQDGQLRLEVPTLEERVRYMRLKLKHLLHDDKKAIPNIISNGLVEEEDVWQAALEAVAEGMSTVTIPQLLALSTETLHARVQAALETHNKDSNNSTVNVTHSVASSSTLQHASPTSSDDITMATYYGHLFGLEEMIRRVEELIVWPLTHLPLLRKMNIPCPRGVLLLGSSGTGKTALLSALARRLHGLHRTGLHTIVLDGLSLLTKEVGRSERNIAELFARARALAPTAIFLDNLDALAPPRGKQSQESNVTADRTLSTLLTEMDGVQVDGAHLVIVLASAPSLTCLDAAVYRPGRLDIHLTLPRLTSTVAATAVMTRLAAFHTRMHHDSNNDSDEWRQAVQDYVEGYVSAHTQSGTGSEVSAAQLVAAVRDVLLHFVQHPDTPWQGEVLVRLLRKALNET